MARLSRPPVARTRLNLAWPSSLRLKPRRSGSCPRRLLIFGCWKKHRQRIAGAASRSGDRSEEHTSELQSLMRISYAVFCLKKTNNTTTQINTPFTKQAKEQQ